MEKLELASEAILRTWYESIRTKIGVVDEGRHREGPISQGELWHLEGPHLPDAGSKRLECESDMEKQNCNSTLTCYFLTLNDMKYIIGAIFMFYLSFLPIIYLICVLSFLSPHS